MSHLTSHTYSHTMQWHHRHFRASVPDKTGKTNTYCGRYQKNKLWHRICNPPYKQSHCKVETSCISKAISRALRNAKSRFCESQIIKALKVVGVGRTATDVCREYGISNVTSYKYGGMELPGMWLLGELKGDFYCDWGDLALAGRGSCLYRYPSH